MATKLLKTSICMTLLFLAFFHSVDAGFGVCKRKVLFTKIKFTCPEPGQPSDYLFCCGDDDDLGGQYCCNRGIEIDNLGSIIGTIAAVLGFLLLLLVICCCICPCCILYKRRTGGNVYRSTTVPNPVGPSSVNVTVVPAAGAPAQGPPPVGFVTGPSSGYPSQTGYPPQPGYMQQPPAGYAPYPTQSGPSPYPMQPTPQQVPHQQGYYSDQPPPYPGAQEVYQKQAPYNPAY